MFRAIFLSSMFMCLLAYGQFYFILFLFESYYIFYPPILCVSIWTEIRFIFFSLAAIKKTERAYFYVWLSTLYLAFFGSSNIFVFAVSWFCLWIFCAKRLHSSIPFFGYTICNLIQNASIASKLKVKSSDLQSHCIRKFHEVECAHFETKTYKQTKTQKECRQLVQKPYQICK